LWWSEKITNRSSTAMSRLEAVEESHPGSRDGADDFRRCQRAYNAALVYYHFLGWRLVELGDVEELWENTFTEVASSYPQTLRLAADFHADGASWLRARILSGRGARAVPGR
jgi:hypothetical protein